MASVIVVVSSGTVKIIIHDPQPACKPLDEGFRAVFGIQAAGEKTLSYKGASGMRENLPLGISFGRVLWYDTGKQTQRLWIPRSNNEAHLRRALPSL